MLSVGSETESGERGVAESPGVMDQEHRQRKEPWIWGQGNWVTWDTTFHFSRPWLLSLQTTDAGVLPADGVKRGRTSSESAWEMSGARF